MSGMAKLNSAIRVVTGLVGLALIGYFLLFFVREATKMSGWHRSGGIWSETRMTTDSLVVFTCVDPTDFVSGTAPQSGDTVTAIADTALSLSQWNNTFDSLRAPGEEIPIEFRHAGTVASAVIKTRTPPTYLYVLEMVLQVLRFLIAGLSIGVGLWRSSRVPIRPRFAR